MKCLVRDVGFFERVNASVVGQGALSLLEGRIQTYRKWHPYGKLTFIDALRSSSLVRVPTLAVACNDNAPTVDDRKSRGAVVVLLDVVDALSQFADTFEDHWVEFGINATLTDHVFDRLDDLVELFDGENAILPQVEFSACTRNQIL